MKTLTNTLNQLTPFLLILLWVYAPVSKLVDFRHYKWEMYNQVFDHGMAGLLIYLLPAAELFTAGLLCFEKTRRSGLLLSVIMLSAFSIYIGLISLHFFSRVPCSCGGILEHMTWPVHLAFNLFLVALTALTIFITDEKEVAAKKA